MNYLAHALLSSNDPQLQAGNFIADHIRGNNFDNLPPQIIQGIKLHRAIDSFTDNHPLFRQSKRVFYKGFEKHSGVLVDIYFDHLLAINFPNFSSTSLSHFAKTAYENYELFQSLFPERSKNFLTYLLRNDLYSSYASLQGIQLVLSGLSKRINHHVLLENSIPLFLENKDFLNSSFMSFFEDAVVKIYGRKL